MYQVFTSPKICSGTDWFDDISVKFRTTHLYFFAYLTNITLRLVYKYFLWFQCAILLHDKWGNNFYTILLETSEWMHNASFYPVCDVLVSTEPEVSGTCTDATTEEFNKSKL